MEPGVETSQRFHSEYRRTYCTCSAMDEGRVDNSQENTPRDRGKGQSAQEWKGQSG